MQDINKAILRGLINTRAEPAVTIYVPMHTAASPPHISENQIRFKNLMHKAAQRLRREHTHSSLPAKLEQAVAETHNNLPFWEEQKPGLLICATADKIQMFHLPIDTEEHLSIDNNFYLAPVIGLLHDEHEFYVLALAQHDPKLYKGSLLYGLTPLKARLPKNPQDALGLDETNQRTERQGSVVGPSSGPHSFNGRGGARDPKEEDRLRFFRLIDKAIHGSLDRRLPLILAGVESELAEYREISKYPHILNGSIHGNHILDNPRQLFEAAERIIRREIVAPEHLSVANEYRLINGANPSRAVHDSASIIEAAEQGRVDKLLARMSQQTADTVQDSAKDLPRITFPESEDDSRWLNQVVMWVWQASGTVLNLQPNEMPEATLMAARLRY